MVNAYILYKLHHSENITQKDFRRQIIDGLLANRLIYIKRKKSDSILPIRISKHKPIVPVEMFGKKQAMFSELPQWDKIF